MPSVGGIAEEPGATVPRIATPSGGHRAAYAAGIVATTLVVMLCSGGWAMLRRRNNG
jgi:hypothetical protein